KITFYCQHVDTYGNIITNLDKQLFEKVANGRKSFSFYNSALGCIEKCSLLDTYTYTTSSNYIFIFSQSGFLEIARKYTPLAYFLNLDNKKFKDWQFIITFL
ncbi:MAG: SAM-dependent chlorinase/fluorinase, partial [Bacteroidales bacterium]|nr:SAM-dependent chlorinase/fluorinase [Bacteroidales bacterium]